MHIKLTGIRMTIDDKEGVKVDLVLLKAWGGGILYNEQIGFSSRMAWSESSIFVQFVSPINE